jgi:hypothetical protein
MMEKMSLVEKKLFALYEQRVRAIKAYQLYPGEKELTHIQVLRKQIEALEEEQERIQSGDSQDVPQRMRADDSRDVPQRILDFLGKVKEARYSEIQKGCSLTKDQCRHGLLKLLKGNQIEKGEGGQYRVISHII